MAPPVLAPAWQQPYVNVFKLCDVDNLKEVEMLGDVVPHMDRIIGKKVFKIRGMIPAGNYIRVPKLKSQTLGLTGRFLYMQIKVSPVKVFVIHLEVVTADLIVHRVSISSMYKAETVRRKSSGIQYPFPQASHRWCVAAVDLAGAVSRFTTSPFHSLRSVQLCSWLTVRSMYTSDMKFSLHSLPRDMALSHALDTSVFEMTWIPTEPLDVEEADAAPMPRMSAERVGQSSSRRNTAESLAYSMDSPASPGRHAPPHSPSARVPSVPPVYTASSEAAHMSSTAHALAGQLAQSVRVSSPPKGPQSTITQAGQAIAPGPTSSRGTFIPARRDAQADDQALADVHGPVLEPDPALSLVRVNAYSGELPRSVAWPPHSTEIVFTAGSVVVAMQGDGSSQRFFLGHTAHVVATAFDGEGAIMATAQEGKQAVIRIWAYHSGQCISILSGHASGLLAVDISQDGRALVAVGLDAGARQLVVLWDISQLRYGGRPEVVCRHVTEYNIKAIRFSVYEEDQLVTCGRDNVRTYRLKNNQLRGVTVRIGAPDKKVTLYAGGLTAALGPNVFTDIAFEPTVGVYAPESQHIYVASASGALFVIENSTRTLLCVYQLHSAAINQLVVSQGLCVTASEDRLLRVWPLDFSDFLMEAENESSVSAVALSPDGLRAAIGTESGTIGVLDIPSHEYTTLLRSHVGCVNAVAVNPNRDEYCTVSSDGTVRLWDLATSQQRIQFQVPGEQVVCAAYHPRQAELACGFANGRLRVFDVATATLIQEHQQHRGALVELAYAPDGSRLYTGGADGGLCVYDVAQVYSPTKFLTAGVRDLQVCLAVSPDGRYLATVSRDPYRNITSILVFHGPTLEPYMRIETNTPSFARLAFSADSEEVWAVAGPNRLDRYELFEGQLLQQVSGAHRMDINTLVPDPEGRFVATAGNDALVKVWAVTPRTAPRQYLQDAVPPHQAFGGHPSAILGSAVKGNYLITVGDDDAVFVWHINCLEAAGAGLTGTAAAMAASQRAAETRQYQPAEPATTLAQARLAGTHGSGLNTPKVTSKGPVPNAAGTTSSYTDAAAGTGPRHTPPTPTVGRPAVLPTTRPGPEAVLHATSLTFPAAAPMSTTVVGYTPSGLSQNVSWHADSGLFVYAVDNLVVAEDLGSHQQTVFSHFTQPVSCVATSSDGKLLAAGAAATEPSQFADIALWDVPSKSKVCSLQYHPLAVEAVCFSQDGHYLVSVGRDPERTVVVWDVWSALGEGLGQAPALQGHIAGVGRTRTATMGAAWLPPGSGPGATGAGSPRFVTVGDQGLLLWTLQPTCLEQVSIDLPEPVSLSASSPRAPTGPVAATAATADPTGLVLVADARGGVWEVDLGQSGGHTVTIRHMADLPGAHVTRITACNTEMVALGTLGGLVTMYQRSDASGGVWTCHSDLHLDGAVTALCFEPGMRECVAATTSCTLWYCHLGDAWRVPLVGGHAAAVTTLSGPKAGWHEGRTGPSRSSLLLSSAEDGAVRLWRLSEQLEPLSEFQSGVSCTCAALVPGAASWRTSSPAKSPRITTPRAHSPSPTGTPRAAAGPPRHGWSPAQDASLADVCVAAGFADGSVRMFTVGGDELAVQWNSARHSAPVVGLAVHPQGRYLLSAGEDGALAVTELRTSRLVVYLEHFVAGSKQQALLMPEVKSAVDQGSSTSQALCSLDVSEADASVCVAAWRGHMVVFATPWDDTLVRLLALYRCEPSAGAQSTDVPAAAQFVPRSTKLVAYSSPLLLGKVLLFDYRLASVVRSVSLTQMVRSLSLSPSGGLLAAGCMGGSVFLVDVESGRWEELQGHRGPVTASVFSRDSARLVTSSGLVMQVWGVRGRLDIPDSVKRASKLLQLP